MVGCSDDASDVLIPDVTDAQEISPEIEKVITSALNATYVALVSGDMQKLQSDLDGLYGDEALALQAFNLTKSERLTSVSRGFFCEEVSSEFTFHYSESEISEERAVVVMTEDNKEKSSINGESVTSYARTKHQFTLEKRDGRWLITSDIFLNSQQPEISDGEAVPPIRGAVNGR